MGGRRSGHIQPGDLPHLGFTFFLNEKSRDGHFLGLFSGLTTSGLWVGVSVTAVANLISSDGSVEMQGLKASKEHGPHGLLVSIREKNLLQ